MIMHYISKMIIIHIETVLHRNLLISLTIPDLTSTSKTFKMSSIDVANFKFQYLGEYI